MLFPSFALIVIVDNAGMVAVAAILTSIMSSPAAALIERSVLLLKVIV